MFYWSVNHLSCIQWKVSNRQGKGRMPTRQYRSCILWFMNIFNIYASKDHIKIVILYRSIVVRRCGLVGASVWSQKSQACVYPGSPVGGPQVQPPQTHGSHHHPYHQKHRGGTTLAGSSNPCRHGGPPFFRPHPTSPYKYIQCSATGRAFVRKCPRGLRWNQRALTCDRSVPGTVRHLLT